MRGGRHHRSPELSRLQFAESFGTFHGPSTRGEGGAAALRCARAKGAKVVRSGLKSTHQCPENAVSSIIPSW
jgi:hypothetical protein